MTEIKNVRGAVESVKPLEYGKDTVYVSTNIHTVEEDGIVQAEFDLKMYSYPEWVEKQNEDIDDINNALIELAELIGG